MAKLNLNMRTLHVGIVYFIYCACLLRSAQGCQFYPIGEYLRFIRVPENLKVGGEVLKLEVHPRKNLSLQPIDKPEDASFFTHRDLNSSHISVILAKSLEDLVDRDNPQNVLKFRLGCDFTDGSDLISAFLSVTVYVEDINDQAPVFIDAPYEVEVDELTPVGLTIFKNIHAFDRDKPNTPNSDVQYAIVAGNEKGKFTLESSHKAALVIRKPLDYDTGDREFFLTVTASDRGYPPQSTNTTVHVVVLDNDDLNPRFTSDVYTTQINEFYPIKDIKINMELPFKNPIRAYDQDTGIDAPLRYDLISGNERHLFALDPVNGSLFLRREIDLDAETSLPANTFVLQIQASQIDNPLRTAVARVEVEILDLNDNLPEFEVDFYNISIVENLPNGFSVLQVMATDRDQGDNGEFTYQLNDPHGAFSIDPRTGWLTVRDQNVLDRETHSSLKMKVYAKEKNPSVVGLNQNEIISRSSKRRRNSPTPRPTPKSTNVYLDRPEINRENVEYNPDTKQFMSFVNVEVTLLDANDNNPVFLPNNLYEFKIKSNARIGEVIGKVKAVDPDLGRNGMVLYDIQRTSNITITSPFLVDAQTGTITVAETPLVEGHHALFVEASDQPANPSERRFTLAVVTIEVVKPNKGQKPLKPSFIGAPYEFWVGANVGIGTSVGQLRVGEIANKNELIYDLLHNYHEGVPFAVEERSGTISVVDDLSKFNRVLYDFEAVAAQEKADITLITNVTIHVVDPADERGILMKGAINSPIVFHVKENLEGAIIGQLLYQNNSFNSQGNHSKTLRFIIANQQDVTDDIAIGQDGTLYTQKRLDREKRDIYRLTIIAEYNKGAVSGAGIYQVIIYVDDENDNAPIFQHAPYSGRIFENSPNGTEVNMTNIIYASDADIGENAIVTYKMYGEGHNLFQIDQTTRRLYFVGTKLDREEKSVYTFRLVARDRGNLSSETRLVINIIDVNDNKPKFVQMTIPAGEGIDILEYDSTHSKVKIVEEKKSGTGGYLAEVKSKNKFVFTTTDIGPLLSIPETVTVGSTILRLQAIDIDEGINGEIKYDLESETYVPNYAIPGKLQVKQYFLVNELTGDVIVGRGLPAESEFRLNVSATDGGNLKDFVNVRFYVKDVNDHVPTFRKSWYSYDVEEALYSRRVLGKIEATDADYGQNGNITYKIVSDEHLPFEISPTGGILSVNGELDRETQSHYTFLVVGSDNGSVRRHSSSVTVEVNVLDVNDNAPQFYGFDEVIQLPPPDLDEYPNHNFDSVLALPVYHAALKENSPIGTAVTRVFANDSDFAGNGNGLIFFDILQRKNLPNLFSIDSKDGLVSLAGKLDYETAKTHNVTIIASDLGSPSLSSTALLTVKVIDVPDDQENTERAVFANRYYEIEIEENSHTPVELLTLNVTDYYKSMPLKFYIVGDDRSENKKTFVIDPRNGTLYLVRSPDREVRDSYEVIVRVEIQKSGRSLPHIIYPISDEKLNGVSKNEVKVVVKIKDVNDNPPRFTVHGRPIVTAIPTTATYGYHVLRLQATDADLGINAEIRYQIINDHSQRFSIDPISGQVRAISTFSRDAGKVFGFDVKATDRKGADDGKSAIANVFVYILDEDKQLVLVMDAKPTEIERGMANITSALTSATGLDVRVRKLEAHSKSALESIGTDMYIYAVDPMSNAIIDTETLQKALLQKEFELKAELAPYVILEVGGQHLSQVKIGRLLSPMELGIVVLGCLVFLGALTTAICILCVRRTKRRRNKIYSQHRPKPLAFTTEQFSKFGTLFPSGENQCQELQQSCGGSDYIDMLHSHSNKPGIICPHGNTIDEFGKAHQSCIKNQYPGDGKITEFNAQQRHEVNCIKFNKRNGKKRPNDAVQTSITSVNSSGQDSGIVEMRCLCGHSPMQTSEDSSNGSYEDSLKSSSDLKNKGPYFHHRTLPPYDEELDGSKDFSSHYTIPNVRPKRVHMSEEPKPGSREDAIRNSRRVTMKTNPGLFVHRGPKPSSSAQEFSLNQDKLFVEPIIDYDESENEESAKDRKERHDMLRHQLKGSKLLELSDQAAVFVATPAAAAIMRKQGSERLVLARPL